MKVFSAVATVVALAFAGLVQAHAHLTASQPAEGSVVSAAPANIVLDFSESARLTALTLQKDGKSEDKLAPLPTVSAKQVSIPAPKLAAGAYALNWRAISDDGHITFGTLRFTIDPKAATQAH